MDRVKVLHTFVARRTALIKRIADTLRNDERFVAAWLTGSFGRGKQDDLSDIDLRVVIADAASDILCARPWPHGARTTGERLALFRQFGEPSLIYDAHENAPEGGVFTYVLYQESALNVDWILVPQATARREQETLLLFDKIGIPMEEPPAPLSVEERAEKASIAAGFFWLMTPIAIKYMLRDKDVTFQDFLEALHAALEDMKGQIAGEPVPYHGGAYAPLYLTQTERVTAIRRLCDEVLELMPTIARMGGSVPVDPMSVVNTWLAMVDHPELRAAYAANREAVLARIVETFQQDERFVAFWLAGSYGRGEQDELSDLDVRLVVANAYAEQLCHVAWDSARPQATAERLALVSQFGKPGIVWESRSWVGENSSFTLTHYSESGLHIDWVLLPQANARVEQEAIVLFDKVGLPEEHQPELGSQEERAILASDKAGFFWMIAAETIKSLARGDLASFHIMLDWLHNALSEAQAALHDNSHAYQRETTLLLTREAQTAALRDLCQRMIELMPQIAAIGGYIPDSPMAVIEARLALIA